MNDSEVSAEQFSAMFQEECENVAKNAFGKIKLSLEEVKSIASDISFFNFANVLKIFFSVPCFLIRGRTRARGMRSEEHTSELQSQR